MATVIINEKTKAGKTLIEYLKNLEYATVIENSKAIDSVSKGLSELDLAKKGKLKGKPAKKFLSEL